jgi:hypothetical protein
LLSEWRMCSSSLSDARDLSLHTRGMMHTAQLPTTTRNQKRNRGSSDMTNLISSTNRSGRKYRTKEVLGSCTPILACTRDIVVGLTSLLLNMQPSRPQTCTESSAARMVSPKWSGEELASSTEHPVKQSVWRAGCSWLEAASPTCHGDRQRIPAISRLRCHTPQQVLAGQQLAQVEGCDCRNSASFWHSGSLKRVDSQGAEGQAFFRTG